MQRDTAKIKKNPTSIISTTLKLITADRMLAKAKKNTEALEKGTFGIGH